MEWKKSQWEEMRSGGQEADSEGLLTNVMIGFYSEWNEKSWEGFESIIDNI